ncbi:single-stranded DNA-binding protein [Klenkia brasiliensis]|uniref:Single-strand DNA-binding protein n=1 Tax=Klenkia brasiliensis TaxID=333142 RepID=A0A1G8AG68_9ACTN|nr:single-stranded DNA-binding protein [Klenkia brasiliensis]SDH19320.1 single-strand DNA-binding protein [Klenkia brasiliensis]
MSLSVIDRNDVALRGRLAAPVELRELPSGDTLLVFRLTVRRPAPRSREPRSREPRQDTITCVSFTRALITRSSGWQPGDLLEVEGSLRRRFWRTPTGRAVAHEVDCRRVRKCRVPVRRPESELDAG